jgi:diguanylate cyclase (GGDEF)-like protein
MEARSGLKHLTLLRLIERRLALRRDAEHIQALARLAIVTLIGLYVYVQSPDPSVTNPDYLALGRQVVLMSFAVSLGLFTAVVANPVASPPRRVLGIVHDVAFLTVAMFLGEAGAGPFAALYLLVALGNGFRYGTRYLYFAACLSIAAFAVVYSESDYWRSQWTLSVNIFVLLAVVPFYVARLLHSLHKAKDQLKRQASHDVLTGLLNRAEFESIVEEVLAHEPGAHALLFCDLDHFKRVNDGAGHAAGDKLLEDVGAIIARAVRESDVCSRSGGDEFCVLLKRCSLDKARELAEQIRSRVAGYRLAWGRDYFSVGISIGVAPTTAVADATSLFRLADAACYAAKNAGRNQIHVVDPRFEGIDTGRIRRLFSDADGNVVAATDARNGAAR